MIVPRDAPDDLIRAAGGIVVRHANGGRVEVACIFREARSDWTFPKGKLDEGESASALQRAVAQLLRGAYW